MSDFSWARYLLVAFANNTIRHLLLQNTIAKLDMFCDNRVIDHDHGITLLPRMRQDPCSQQLLACILVGIVRIVHPRDKTLSVYVGYNILRKIEPRDALGWRGLSLHSRVEVSSLTPYNGTPTKMIASID